MKDWNTATQEELSLEGEKVFGLVTNDDEIADGTQNPLEVLMYLRGKPALFYVFTYLRFLKRFDLLSGVRHKDIAEFLDLSEPSFLRYRDLLVSINLLKLEKVTASKRAIDITPQLLPRLDNKELQR